MEKDFSTTELYEDEKYRRFKERRSALRFFMVIIALLLCTFVFRIYWTDTFGGVVVDGVSMSPTLKSGQKLLMKL